MSTINTILTEFLPKAADHIKQSYGQVLSNGLDERSNHPISLSHFLPYTEFKDGIDQSNGDSYWHDDPRVSRLKCLGLVAATPIIHAIGLILNLANRIAKIVTFAHFWHPSLQHHSLSEKAWTFSTDVLRVAFTPIIYLGLELSTIYGLILPDQGSKLYATFERCAYGKELLAPCFQPHATYHLGGGTPGKKNAW